MSIYSNAALDDELVPPQPTPEPSWRAQDAGRPIREIQVVCSKHNLHCGSPEDLAGFLRALGTNKLLAMNFWSTVARLGDGKHGPTLNPAEILAVIVQGVTGQPLEDAKVSNEILVDKLTRLLAGEDVDLTGAGSSAPAAAEPPAPTERRPVRAIVGPRDTWEATQAKATAWRDPRLEQPSPPQTPESRQSDTSHEAAGLSTAIDHPTATGDPTATDQPPVEAVAQQSTHRWSGMLFEPSPEPQPAPGPAPVSEQEPIALRAPDRGPRLVLKPEPDFRPAEDRREVHDEVPIHREAPIAFTPLSGYAAADDKERPRRRIAAAVLVLVLVAGAWLFFSQGYSAWQEPGNTAHEGIMSFGQRSAAAFSRIGDSVHAGFSSARDTWHGQSAPSQPTANGPRTSNDNDAGQAATTPPSSATPAQAPASAARHDDSARTTAVQEDRRERGLGPEASLAGDTVDTHGGEMVVVPAALMHDRLISSRIPILPDSVDSRHGFVVVRAIVTSRGTVRDIHVIAGRPELRQAAIDAVSAWHYRPWLLNGTPVDVATSITVNFDGND